MNEVLDRKYAKLVIKTGVNLQKGQPLIIASSIDAAPFVRLLVEEAYLAGASNVIVDWTDKEVARCKIKYATEDALEVQDYQISRYHYLIDQDFARIHILCDDPNEFDGLDMSKMIKARMKSAPKVRFFSEHYGNSKGQWCIVGYPEANWAKLVFPTDQAEEAYEKLYQAILKASHVTLDNDPIAEWDELNKQFLTINEKLNSFAFSKLHFQNSIGTDLEVGLIKDHIWAGGGEYSTKGIYFNPNIPTEENFTMPDNKRINGIVYATKPLSSAGKVIKDFWFKFENGKVVDFGAKENYDELAHIVNFDEGSSSLGEVAIVPFDSPISKSNILFFETLYDENASCHLALGSSYVATNLKNGLSYSDEQLKELGSNISNTHVDFMFGSSDMKITGTKEDGTEVVIFENGKYII